MSPARRSPHQVFLPVTGRAPVDSAADPVVGCLAGRVRLRRRVGRGRSGSANRVGWANWVRYSTAYRPPAASSWSCVPRSTIRPCSTTAISSAARMVESRCAMTIAVRPARASASAACTAASDSESRCAVASSRITTRGLASSSRAIVSRWRSPPESRYPRSPTTVSRPSGSVSSRSPSRARRSASSDLGVGRLRRRVAQVGPDGVVEQVPVLGDHADRARERRRRSGRARRSRTARRRRSRRRRAAGPARRWSTCPRRTSRRARAAGRRRPRGRPRAAPPRRSGCRAPPRPPARPARPCPRRVAEPHVAQPHRHRPVRAAHGRPASR